MTKGPNPERVPAKPPLQHARRADGREPKPEARLLRKHAMNAPIVTVFGAGVAGLTAAQELVERGFLVQVVEAAEDLYYPGRPAVGGMAANQPARVRAGVEELHPGVIALSRGNDGEGKVARWLLKLFALNRTRWLSTETPVRIQTSLFSPPKTVDHAAFVKALLESLREARRVYRQQWMWDLAVRTVLADHVWYKDRPKDKEAAQRQAIKFYNEFVDYDDTATLARVFHEIQVVTTEQQKVDRPTGEEMARYSESLVVPAIEREFLCFRLIAHSLPSFKKAPDDARKLFLDWSSFLAGEFRHNFLVDALDENNVPVQPAAFHPDRDAGLRRWVELEVIEQRLPGEHGYRFFPSFYRHLDDTMKRIPLYIAGVPSGRSVYDNLKPTRFQGIGLSQDDRKKVAELGGKLAEPQSSRRSSSLGSVVELHRDRPRSLEGLRNRTDRFVQRIGGTQRDAVMLLARLVRFMTSSRERRRKEYEILNWKDFLSGKDGVSGFSPVMKQHIESASQALLAFSASEADARTYGNVAVQMLLDQLDDGARVDRTLNGPTSDAWLEPWREYLERQGVRFFNEKLVKLVPSEDGLIPVLERDLDDEKQRKPALLSQDGYALLTHQKDPALSGLSPDFYVLALSLEQTVGLIEPLYPKEKQATDFTKLREFWGAVVEKRALKTMTGVQFFLDAKTSIGRGHMYFPFSSWGLSSISQSEFWSARGGFSDGYFGVLSVDVCTTGAEDGSEPGSFWKVLKAVGKEPIVNGDEKSSTFEVAHQIWNEIVPRISAADQIAQPRYFHVDRGISREGNSTKYLANLAELDANRPGRSSDVKYVGEREISYALNYERWVLCGAFMATHTRMTTMEAANESARHAVSKILEALSIDDAESPESGTHGGQMIEIADLHNKTYNGASKRRVYDPPDTWNLEEEELEDLEIFKRVDRRLTELGLPHFLDIIDFDKKLKHALEGIELYGKEIALKDLIGASAASLDTVLAKELGPGYVEDQFRKRVEGGTTQVGRMRDGLTEPVFQDLKTMLDRLHTVLGAISFKEEP